MAGDDDQRPAVEHNDLTEQQPSQTSIDNNSTTPRTTNNILETLDNTKFSKVHVKAVLVAGIGFFTDAYDVFIINLVVPMISQVYWGGEIPTMVETAIKASATVGTFCGQVGFGILADRKGRKKMYGLELIMMIVSTLGCAFAFNAGVPHHALLITLLCVWRFILGVGIGGDYPLSAVITSEFASANRRGMMMAAVFSMQGIGILCAGLVSIITLNIFKHSIQHNPHNIDYVWRICLGFGIIPAIAAVYFRRTLPESPRYTMHVIGDASQAAEDIDTVLGAGDSRMGNSTEDSQNVPMHVVESKSVVPTENSQSNQSLEKDKKDDAPTTEYSWKDFKNHFGKWSNFKVLMGCSMAWFCLDVAYYGLNLNQSIVLSAIGYVGAESPYDKLHQIIVGNIIISLMGTIPGYFVSIALIEKLGRIKIQYLGFTVLTIVFVILSAFYHQIRSKAIALFIFLYCVGLFFFNFGPNTTTFIIPGEVFPTRYRSTGHGIAAGSGKLGAMVGAYGFGPVSKSHSGGIRLVLGILSAFMALGGAFTYFVPETKGLTLEQLANEEEKPHRRNQVVV